MLTIASGVVLGLIAFTVMCCIVCFFLKAGPVFLEIIWENIKTLRGFALFLVFISALMTFLHDLFK
jgi:hypothetical protein